MTPAALALAARGLPVFPLIGKAPATKRGFLDATTDPGQIRGRRWAGVGVRTGTPLPSGDLLLVIDLDLDKPGIVCGPDAAAILRPHLPPTAAAETGSGGLHLYYRTPAEGSPTIGARIVCEGITLGADWRCRGGYVVAPPSIHPGTGRAYRWLPPGSDQWGLTVGRGIQPAPASLIALCRPRPAVVAPLPTAPLSEDDRVRRYGQAALDRVVARVRELGIGERHRGAFGPICGVGALIGGGAIPADHAEAVLVEAMCAAGLDTREARRLVRRGLHAGMTTPRTPDLRGDR